MNNPVDELRELVAGSSQQAVARHLKISQQMISMVLSGQRDPGKKVLTALGLKRQVSYRRVRRHK